MAVAPMDSALLATKLRVPSQTHRLVRRVQLVDRLDRVLPEFKLVLVSAPAGYGKTTLVAQWAGASRFAVAWVSLGEEDNDIERFLRYLFAAWARIQPSIRGSTLGILLGAMAPDRDAVLAAFINVAADRADHLVMVLDDYHLIGEPSIHEAMAFLLDHLPPRLHFVLICRGEPPLPLARYRARHQLVDLRTESLSFSREETRTFLRETRGLDLPDREADALHDQLEGWAAALQLVSLTLERHDRPADRLVISGRHRFIADYLRDDVLVRLPDDLRNFLLQTSILDRLCGPLCDAVTGLRTGQETLELLERQNLFLVALDDERGWYRYHRLFADVLRDELSRRAGTLVTELHCRAAEWYLAHEMPDPAFPHAVAGNDPDLVVRLLERYSNLKLNSGEFNLVATWLDTVPAAWSITHPLIELFRAGVLAFSGALDDCIRCIDDTERRLTAAGPDNPDWQLAIITAVRCFIACIQNDMERAELFAHRALPRLRNESIAFRATIFQALGDTYRRHGRWEDARNCYLKVLTFTHWPDYRIQSAHVFGALADLELQRGRLRSAADCWRQALAAIEDDASWGRVPLPVIGWVFIRLGELLYEWNELDAARDFLQRGVERAELGGDVRTLIAGHVIAARLKLTDGDVAAAADELERARPLVEHASFSDWSSRFERGQLEVWLAQGLAQTALDWCDDMLIEAQPERDSVQLAGAHLLIAQGNPSDFARAMEVLAMLRQAAESDGRMSVQIEALALQALAHRQRDDLIGAMTALEQALRLAEPEGYIRLFADLGLPMARLLQEARSRQVMPDYVATLLGAFDIDDRNSVAHAPALPEPLSPREHQVLDLIAAGLTNREIADALSISPQTVKKHADSIYGKLGVGNRTEAAARARALELLG